VTPKKGVRSFTKTKKKGGGALKKNKKTKGNRPIWVTMGTGKKKRRGVEVRGEKWIDTGQLLIIGATGESPKGGGWGKKRSPEVKVSRGLRIDRPKETGGGGRREKGKGPFCTGGDARTNKDKKGGTMLKKVRGVQGEDGRGTKNGGTTNKKKKKRGLAKPKPKKRKKRELPTSDNFLRVHRTFREKNMGKGGKPLF